MATKAGRGSDQFMVRLPAGMRDQIRRSAEENGRSMNSEIVDVLREYFPDEPGVPELLDVVQHSLSLLRELMRVSPPGDLRGGTKLLNVLGELEHANDRLMAIVGEGHQPRIVVLSTDVARKIEQVRKEFDLSIPHHDGIVDGLLLMGLERVMERGENLLIPIGEGEGMRTVEIARPEEQKP